MHMHAVCRINCVNRESEAVYYVCYVFRVGDPLLECSVYIHGDIYIVSYVHVYSRG